MRASDAGAVEHALQPQRKRLIELIKAGAFDTPAAERTARRARLVKVRAKLPAAKQQMFTAKRAQLLLLIVVDYGNGLTQLDPSMCVVKREWRVFLVFGRWSGRGIS